MLRALAFIVLVGMIIDGQAADDEPIRVPFVEKGDCWSYRAQNVRYQGKPVTDYELCVTLVDNVRGKILAVATTKDDGREIDTVFSTEWAIHASVTGAISPDGIKHYKFPLKTGDNYSTEYEFHVPRLNGSNGRARLEMKAVGWEDVVVFAGTFRAMKIEGRGTTWRDSRSNESPQTITLWYSPKVNRFVKMRFKSSSLEVAEELTGYRLKE